MTGARDRLADALGLYHGYHGLDGSWHETTAETKVALLGAMGYAAETDAGAAAALADWQEIAADSPGWQVVAEGTPPRLDPGRDADWQIAFDAGTTTEGRGAESLPDLPAGYHRLWQGGRLTHLLAAPERLPPPPRAWGVTLSMAGLRSPEIGGIGDYRDLACAARGLGGLGAGFVGINPVHAGFPDDPCAFSPYTPSHRGRFDTRPVAVDGESGAPGPLIDFDVDQPRHRAALRAAWAAFEARGGDPVFEAYLQKGGASLDRFALHQALSARHGAYWRDWPADLQTASGVAPDTVPVSERRFHAWAQWQAETQLGLVHAAARGAGMGLGLYLDLAVGTHPHGAETWERPELFARGVSLGAPPDAFAPQGQSWSLAPLIPQAMVADGFAHFARTLAQQMRFAGVLRIDHVMGLMRAFWAPENGVPGSYVAMPIDALLAVIRIEASRTGTVVIGEDLGLVPDGLRDALHRSGLLSMRLMMFDDMHPGDYPADTLAGFATHDLPTWAGWRQARDVAIRQELGIIDADAARAMQTDRAHQVRRLDGMIGGDTANAMHSALGQAGSALVAVQAVDALGLLDQANLPGTVDGYPNWRQRLPVDATGLARHPGMVETARILNHARPKEA